MITDAQVKAAKLALHAAMARMKIANRSRGGLPLINPWAVDTGLVGAGAERFFPREDMAKEWVMQEAVRAALEAAAKVAQDETASQSSS